MEMESRNKAVIIFSIYSARKLSSELNLMPPFTDSFAEEDEDVQKIKRKILRITNYIEEIIPQFSDKQFQMHFRMSRTTFEMLLPVIHNNVKKSTNKGRPRIDTHRELLAVIWLLATPDSYRSVGERFDMGKSSLSTVFFRVVKALNKIAPQIISWPSNADLPRIKEAFYNKGGIENIIGAIDGTFIQIKAPKNDPEVYITRKCNHAITLQAICDSSLSYTDIFVGYPGSVSDNRIFKNSDIYNNITRNINNYFPEDEFIIADKAYPVLTWCLPPYIDRGNMTAAQRNWNVRIAQTRQIIERSFALLFGRFRRLRYLDMNCVAFIPCTVLAVCTLHNICLRNRDLYIDQYIEEGRDYVHGNEEDNINEINGPAIMQNLLREGQRKRDFLSRHLFAIED